MSEAENRARAQYQSVRQDAGSGALLSTNIRTRVAVLAGPLTTVQMQAVVRHAGYDAPRTKRACVELLVSVLSRVVSSVHQCSLIRG